MASEISPARMVSDYLRTPAFNTTIYPSIKSIQAFEGGQTMRSFLDGQKFWSLPAAKWHQPKMQRPPDRHSKQPDGCQPVPSPIHADVRLDREDGDHEIIREPRVSQETQ